MTDLAKQQPVAPVGPVDASRVPRFAGIATLGRLPRLRTSTGPTSR